MLILFSLIGKMLGVYDSIFGSPIIWWFGLSQEEQNEMKKIHRLEDQKFLACFLKIWGYISNKNI